MLLHSCLERRRAACAFLAFSWPLYSRGSSILLAGWRALGAHDGARRMASLIRNRTGPVGLALARQLTLHQVQETGMQ